MSAPTTPGSPPSAPTSGRAAWLPVTIVALIVGTVFTTVFVGLQREPAPLGLPLTVTGPALASSVQDALGERVDVDVTSSHSEGMDAVRDGRAVAALTLSSSTLQVEYAGAQGLSESGAARGLAADYASSAGLEVAETDVVPLSRYDSRGLVPFYVAFGVTLASFILGQGLTGSAARTRLRARLLVSGGFSILIGVVAATITGPVYDALPAPWPLLALTLALLSAASTLTTMALGAWLGPLGIGVAVLLLTTLGNALSGATIGRDLLPAWAQTLSPILPPGAAVKAVTEYGYFSPGTASTSLVVLALWAAISFGLLLARRAAHRKASIPLT